MTIFDRVNYGLLRQQKRLLVEMVDNGNASNIEANAINGVVSLLDDFMDVAAVELGEYEVFGGPACLGCHSKPEHAAHLLAFQPKRLMGTEPERWLPVCADRAGDWWDLQGGGNTEEERTKAGAPERWLKPLE